MSNIVKIKAIKGETWSGITRFKGTKDSICPMFDSTGTIITGLDKEDEIRLGEVLNHNLSKASPFWHEYRVIMTEKDREFNMENPEHELAVKFLRADRRVANSEEEYKQGIYPYARYVIYDEEVAAKEKNKEFTAKRKATVEFSKLSLQQMVDVLKLYPGFINTNSANADIVESTLFELVEKDPTKFLLLVGDKRLDMKVFLKDLVQAKILRKNKSAFYYGEDPIGHDEESTITFLDDAKHQALKIQLAEQLEQYKRK